MRYKFLIAGTVLSTATVLNVFADENDQYWVTPAVSWKIDDEFSLRVSQQFRWRDGEFYYSETDFSAGYKLSKNWNIVPIYRHQRSKNDAGDWKTTNGYLLDVNNSLKVRELELKSRFRLAYFDSRESHKDSSTEVRPKFALLPKTGLTKLDVKPYIADEMMYDFCEHNFFRNRFSIGVEFKPAKPLSMDLFVMNEQNSKDGEKNWTGHWNCGIGATYSF
ncbi:MAG: DUF2490 domain-containing protein [Kiritimatiellales bacterium]